MKNLLILSTLVLLATACKTTKVATPVKKSSSAVSWQEGVSLYSVLDAATAADKLVFVDLYTDWCLPCKLMDQDVFSDRKMGKYLSDNFVCYKVNAEQGNGPDLAFLYEVKVYPTLLWLDSKGREVLRKEGAAYHTELKKLSEEALAKAVEQ